MKFDWKSWSLLLDHCSLLGSKTTAEMGSSPTSLKSQCRDLDKVPHWADHRVQIQINRYRGEKKLKITGPSSSAMKTILRRSGAAPISFFSIALISQLTYKITWFFLVCLPYQNVSSGSRDFSLLWSLLCAQHVAVSSMRETLDIMKTEHHFPSHNSSICHLYFMVSLTQGCLCSILHLTSAQAGAKSHRRGRSCFK